MAETVFNSALKRKATKEKTAEHFETKPNFLSRAFGVETDSEKKAKAQAEALRKKNSMVERVR